jgi:hypothetical protein
VVGLVLAVVLVWTIGDRWTLLGPVDLGVSTAQALSITHDAGFIVVEVRDPLADPAKYRAEFAAYHLNIRLQMVPASPSVVGSVVFFDGDRQITPITARGRCWTGGGGPTCSVGLRIPASYAGSANIAFGRRARPGEQYESTGLVTAPGEALAGLRSKGVTVARARCCGRDMSRSRSTACPGAGMWTARILAHRVRCSCG